MKRLLSLLLLFGCVALVPMANAHEVRPAFLELTERAPNEFDVLWKVPALGGTQLAGEELAPPPTSVVGPSAESKTMPCGCPVPTANELSRGVTPIHPALPKDAAILSPPRVERIFGAELKRWTIRVPNGLEGWEVTVHGLPSTMVDVLVRIALKDGRVVSRVLRPDAPSFVFEKETAGPAADGYFRLGVEHILFGIDHLLFVLALVLIQGGATFLSPSVAQRQSEGRASGAQGGRNVAFPWGLFKTITAFTVAHSITLGLATLGYVHVPSAPVEATIALSIVFVASEILRGRRGERGLTERAPWLVAATFGLLHGFGFAGALSQVGLPAHDIPFALLFFNLGVEAGQLAFVVGVLAVIGALGRIRLPQWAPILPPYAIGGVAMFWVIQRTITIW
jgi:hypothetical protein